MSNSANLSLFMVNVSQAMLITLNHDSILDMKSRYHALRYAREVFKILPKNQYLRQFEFKLKNQIFRLYK